MTTDLNDNDKQASVYSDIRSLCVNWSVWTREAVWFLYVTLLLNTESEWERVVYPQLKQETHIYFYC